MATLDLNLFGGVIREMSDLPTDVISACETETDALQMCWAYRRIKSMTQRTAADLLEIDRGVFSRMLTGQVNIPPNKRIMFQSLCGNRALFQFEAMVLGRVAQTTGRRASDMGGRRGAA